MSFFDPVEYTTKHHHAECEDLSCRCSLLQAEPITICRTRSTGTGCPVTCTCYLPALMRSCWHICSWCHRLYQDTTLKERNSESIPTPQVKLTFALNLESLTIPVDKDVASASLFSHRQHFHLMIWSHPSILTCHLPSTSSSCRPAIDTPLIAIT